jgi:predicted transcriptional regulator
MVATTTIRLPPKLRARISALAKATDRSAHSLIVEAVERHVAYEEQMRRLIEDALAAMEISNDSARHTPPRTSTAG